MSASSAPLVGVSLTPEAGSVRELSRWTRLADEAGLDLVGIQDHPYQPRFLDTFSLIGVLLGQTERITVFPDVSNLPLRPPAMLAKAAASLDLLSGGRFQLGLGAGAFWDGVAAMGGPRRSPGEAVAALSEAIAVLRAFWSGERVVSFEGSHYSLRGLHPGPTPAHPIEIWVGAYKPRMLALTGRAADGWLPSLGYATIEQLREGQQRIDEAAEAAGRQPQAIRRLVNVSGTITASGSGAASSERAARALGAGQSGPASYWHEQVSELREIGFEGFVFWPAQDPAEQIERLATGVAPLLRT